MNSTIEFIIDYLAERGAELSADNYQGFDFIASGIIDSFETLTFLLVLEKEFGVRVQPEDFIDKEYRYVEKLADFIESNRQAN